MRKAFTMVELIFVIVIIGILSAIAIPKFAATRDDAQIVKGKTTLASVRSAIATERQKRILRGDFTAITSLNAGGGAFSTFSADRDGKNTDVLEYAVPACTNAGCWNASGTTYTFYYNGGTCVFTLNTTTSKLDNNGTCSVFGN